MIEKQPEHISKGMKPLAQRKAENKARHARLKAEEEKKVTEELKAAEDALTATRTGDEGPLLNYDPVLAAEYCAYLAAGLSTRKACEKPGMPSRTTIYNWLRLHDDFRLMYDQAKQDSVEALVDETMDIADDGSNDWMLDNRGNTVMDREHFERSRLRIQTRQWIASRLKAKKYGDRLDLVSDGEKLPAPIFGGMSRAENRKGSKEWSKKPETRKNN